MIVYTGFQCISSAFYLTKEHYVQLVGYFTMNFIKKKEHVFDYNATLKPPVTRGNGVRTIHDMGCRFERIKI